MSVNVRPAEKKDREELTKLMYEYIVDFYQRPRPAVEKVHDLIDMLLEKEEGIQFVAEKEGKLTGFATLYFTYNTTRADKITVMNDLYVVEEERERASPRNCLKPAKTIQRNTAISTCRG